MVQPVRTKAFLQSAKAAAMCMAPHVATCPPLPVPALLLVQNLSSKQIAPTDNMHVAKIRQCQMASSVVKGLKAASLCVTYIKAVSYPYPWWFLQPQFHSLFFFGWIWLAELCTQHQTLLQWTVNFCFWTPLLMPAAKGYAGSLGKLEMTGVYMCRYNHTITSSEKK